ncbi:MAG: hypothetical protein NZM00_04930 [Anaerolinea sp.]|nr:hypothetical protein [Anaerolinea sp.]
MPTYVYLPLLIGSLLGIVFGYFMARRSAKEQRIYGGALAHALNYLGAAVFGAMPASALLTVLTGGGFVRAVLIGIVLSLISLGIFVLFALVERPARAAHQAADEGWTAQKARESGL